MAGSRAFFRRALTLRAAFERVAIPPERRRPAFLIIDEAADYFYANVDALVTQVRKYKLTTAGSAPSSSSVIAAPCRLIAPT